MAVVLVDSFDIYNGVGSNTGAGSKWSLNFGPSGFAMVSGRFGGQALQTNGTQRFASRSFAASSTISAGFAYSVAGFTTSNPFMWLLSASTYMIGLSLEPDGSIAAGRYTSASSRTVLGTSAPGVIAIDTFHYIEVEATINDTTGVFNVYVDGAQELALTSVDTRNGTPTTVNTIQIGCYNAVAMLFDDLYITNTATRLGERRVETLRPSADTATKSFTPSTGSSNYACVDEDLADSSDYVSGSTVGNADLYELTNITGTPSTIDAIQVTMFANKTDAASRNLAAVADIAGTSAQSADFALAASITKLEALMAAKPGGGSWDLTAVNALRVGPKVTL